MRPTVAQGDAERAAACGVQRRHVRREVDRLDLCTYRVVERGVLERRDLSEPVAAAASLPAGEQPVEQMMRRGVDDDA